MLRVCSRVAGDYFAGATGVHDAEPSLEVVPGAHAMHAPAPTPE